MTTISHLDPRTTQCESEVRRIVNLQMIANQLPDAFTDAAKVTKSHIPAANTPARIIVPVEQCNQNFSFSVSGKYYLLSPLVYHASGVQ